MAPHRHAILGAALLAVGRLAGAQQPPAAGNPVQKVVTLLQEMKAQVQKEGEQSELAHEKYQCWCEANGKQKTEAIQSADQKVGQLEASIEKGAATLGSLKAEIGILEGSMAEDSDTLKTAQALRNKESEDFEAREAELKETRDSLKEAIAALSEVQLVQQPGSQHGQDTENLQGQAEAALLQVHRSVLLRRNPRYRSVMQKDLFDMIGSLNVFARNTAADELEDQGTLSTESGEVFRKHGLLPWEQRRKASALQKGLQPSGAAAGATSYGSKSGRILGLLSEMHDEVARDLADSQTAEKRAVGEFQELRAAKMGEVASAQKQHGRKEAAFAKSRMERAEAKEELELTQEASEADSSFLAEMRAACKGEQSQHEKGAKTLQEEVVALGETIQILTEDDSRELFSKTLSFVQTGASRLGAAAGAASKARTATEERLTSRAMRRLAQAARKHKDLALASLAVHVQLDSFTEVRAAMDKMSNELQKKQREESTKRDLCVKDIDATEDKVKEADFKGQDLAEQRTRLASSVETLASEIEELKTQEEETEVSLKQAGEQRKDESEFFQASVMDQRATQTILRKALARLKEFYSSAFAQTGDHSQEYGQAPGQPVAPPPPRPPAYEKSGGAGGAVGVLKLIIQQASEEEQDLLASEKRAQAAYATLVASTHSALDSSRAARQEKAVLKVSAEGEKSDTEEALTANGADSAKLGELLKAHHLDCDFLLKFYKVRQDARAEEIDSIADAKAILAGAKLGN